MSARYISLCESARTSLKRKGYNYLSIHNVYDNDATSPSPKTVTLMPHKSPPTHYLVTLDQADVAALLNNTEYSYYVISGRH